MFINLGDVTINDECAELFSKCELISLNNLSMLLC